MLSSSVNQERIEARCHSLVSGGPAVAILIMLYAWAIGPAAAQPSAAQASVAQSSAAEAYRIGAGDKIGIVVFGQPELSGEVIVDQSGNLRLPIVGDIQAVNLTPSELENSISRSLEQGYVRRPVVSVKIAEFRPIYVLGMVRTPGLYSYQHGQSVLAAIARAGGIGSSEQRSGLGSDLVQADERVRILEVSHAALLAKRARLMAQQKGDDRINFPDMSGLLVDPARIIQIRDSEQRVFLTERQAEAQEIDALQKQIPRLNAEIASLKQQGDLEQRQRDLHQQLVADYEQLSKSGLARKLTYIEVKREEARIEGNIARLKSEALKAELALGDLQFKITELHNSYQRRVMGELRETERSLLELSVTLPSAHRMHAARAQQMGWLTREEVQRPTITVVRAKETTAVKYDAAVEFLLQPGDVVQIGSLLPPVLDLPPDQSVVSRESKAESEVPLWMGDTSTSNRLQLGRRERPGEQ
jgi:polysaccharide export outer membrane protein